MKSLVLVELLITLGAVQAAEVKSSQSSSCYLSCAVKNLSEKQRSFKAEVSERNARVINMTVSSRIYQNESESCHNMSSIDVARNSYLMWAVSVNEPYLYVPLGLRFIPRVLSLHYGTMEIQMQCTLQEAMHLPDEQSETMSAFPDVVMRSIARGLMEATEGTLCSAIDPPDGDTVIAYKCCQFDQAMSKASCSVVDDSNASHWFQMLTILCGVTSVFVAFYLPAIICLFPVWPRISRNGTRCIALEDPSPAGFRTLLVKLFVPENKDSLVNKARFIFMRAVLIPCMITSFPYFLLRYLIGFWPFFALFILLFIVSMIQSIISTFSEPVQRGRCRACYIAFFEVRRHSKLVDEIQDHICALVPALVKTSRVLVEIFKSLICFRPRCQSSKFVFLWYSCCLIPYLAIAIPFFIVSAIIYFFQVLMSLSPLLALLTHELWLLTRFRQRCPSSCILIYMYMLLMIVVCLLQFTWIPLAMVFPYSFLILIDDQDVFLPYLALTLLIVYYLRACFTSFSAKYQQLKIKLFQEIQKYLSSRDDDGNDNLLLLYTESQAIAIPEDLFETACRELDMSMLRQFSLALLLIAGLLIFIFSVVASIMIAGASSGISPLFQALAIFFAGSLPRMFSLFSSDDWDKKLRGTDMEMRLRRVVARYALGRNERSVNGEEQNDTESSNPDSRYGSTSTTITIATSAN